MKKFILSFVTMVSLLAAASSQANQLCFVSAKTYYEQVYCELEAKGKTQGLPSFGEFKRNNEIVQASLLKLPAERNRIVLPPPKKMPRSVDDMSDSPTPVVEKKEIGKKVSATKSVPEVLIDGSISRKFDKSPSAANTTNCQLTATEIQCASKRYRLIGNKANKRLAEGVLREENKMALPLLQQGQSLNVYVTSAYRQYIEKMCAIGLGAVTMTYARFAYLYEDLQSKNVNFVNRFEIMYSYLKKDKASMWISEKIPVNAQLAMHYCELMSEDFYICAVQGQNYIFELERQ